MPKKNEEAVYETKCVSYTKEQILSSKTFKNRVDLLNTILSNNEMYTVEEVQIEIDKFMKRKV